MATSDEITTIYGHVEQIVVEQLDDRDQVHVQIDPDESEDSKWFYSYLDVGASVTLAQLQILRDALIHDKRVRLGYVDKQFYGVRIIK